MRRLFTALLVLIMGFGAFAPVAASQPAVVEDPFEGPCVLESVPEIEYFDESLLLQAEVGPDRVYFPQAGHHLGNDFLDHWRHNGGLYVFGYPLTEEFTEDGRTVQYFERARYEWHPELRGTPYEILLGHLGRQAALDAGVDTSPVERAAGVDNYHPDLWYIPAPPPPAVSPPPGAPSHVSKWIEVDLTNQRVRAWERNRLVYSAIAATGRPMVPTLTGTFQTYLHLRYGNMAGWTPDRGSYNLANVPYIMYYDRGYAIHGAYWHQNFGSPQSAGCVNLPTPDAGWIFNWAPVGTTVYIHGRTPGT